MFVTDAMISEVERRFGVPQFREFEFPATKAELARIRSSQRDGRNHDVTLYIKKDGKLVVIAKHPYPPGLYRAPSGGVHPGETILEGINREALEETGCEIEILRFLLRTAVRFYDPDEPSNEVFWRSFVFTARYLSGDFQYIDHEEISGLKLADWGEFEEFGRIMRQTGSAGLHYRAALHEVVAEILGK
jgi:8-oxo-dGTP pyrophosphatase MutT (NUDIX family)